MYRESKLQPYLSSSKRRDDLSQTSMLLDVRLKSKEESIADLGDRTVKLSIKNSPFINSAFSSNQTISTSLKRRNQEEHTREGISFDS